MNMYTKTQVSVSEYWQFLNIGEKIQKFPQIYENERKKKSETGVFWEHVYIFVAIFSLFAFVCFVRKRKMLRAYVRHLQTGPYLNT